MFHEAIIFHFFFCLYTALKITLIVPYNGHTKRAKNALPFEINCHTIYYNKEMSETVNTQHIFMKAAPL